MLILVLILIPNILSQIFFPYRDCHQNTMPLLFICSLMKLVQEALNSKPRKDAMNEELQAFKKNKTWEVVDLPQGKKTVGCRWIYIIKYKVDRTIERYKVRLVAKRYTQTYGIDYQETFALKEIMSIGVFWIMF